MRDDKLLQEMTRLQMMIRAQERQIRSLERRVSILPARWPKSAAGVAAWFRVGKLYSGAVLRGGEGILQEWSIDDEGGLDAPTDTLHDFVDIGTIEEEQSPVPVGTIALIGKVQGETILFDFDRKSIDFEATLVSQLYRGGESTAKRRNWTGVGWTDTDEEFTIRDLNRIPIGKQLSADDIIGVRRIGIGYFLGDYDCEDLVDV